MIRLRPCSNLAKATVVDQAKWVISSNRQLDGSLLLGLGGEAPADSSGGHYHAFTVTLLRGVRDRKAPKKRTTGRHSSILFSPLGMPRIC